MPIPESIGYEQMVYFHPFVRDFLFGDGSGLREDRPTPTLPPPHLFGMPYSPFIVGSRRLEMNLDIRRIDDAVLALLHLGIHDEGRVWKGHDWAALNRLHQAGFISDPVSKAKSGVLTEEGRIESERLLQLLFGLQTSRE